MIFDLISQYETDKTLASAIELCQFLLDTDQVLSHEGRQYKTLCNYLLLEGCCYDVGYIIWRGSGIWIRDLETDRHWPNQF